MPVVWLLALLVTAVPQQPGAVVVTRRAGMSPAQALELQDRVTRALASSGLGVQVVGGELQSALKRLGVKDPAACNGRRTCVHELMSQLGLTTLVSLSISRVDGETAVAIELLSSGAEQPVAKDSFVLDGEDPAPLLAPFVASARGALAPAPPAPPPAVLVPTTPPAVTVDLPPPLPPPERSRALPVSLAVGGGAVLVAGAVLLVVGAVARGSLAPTTDHAGFRASQLDEATALAKNDEANVATGLGVGASAVGAGLLTGAVLTW